MMNKDFLDSPWAGAIIVLLASLFWYVIHMVLTFVNNYQYDGIQRDQSCSEKQIDQKEIKIIYSWSSKLHLTIDKERCEIKEN